ncbi:hypothetical protein BpHYR1_027071 [Brachionus plicatilis]|uniref:Uncharacterized protein n=1 Tax=Brachionus plicatilis TaxID=10195 RepID=A0A3M7R6B1_BRAPC|nr:hypothetical protein BpHYR1_027071 [Brachionus plicatilis]
MYIIILSEHDLNFQSETKIFLISSSCMHEQNSSKRYQLKLNSLVKFHHYEWMKLHDYLKPDAIGGKFKDNLTFADFI